jgi:hypothetical protein
MRASARERMTLRYLLLIYGLDMLIVLLAVLATVTANPERRSQPFPRHQLLVPGLLSFAGVLILEVDPDIRDLAPGTAWLVVAIGAAIGAGRGWSLRLESDRTRRLVRVMSGHDATWVGGTMVLFATIQGSIETGLRSGNPYETTAEFLMLLPGGYLLGRSLVAWLRACSSTHQDLPEPRAL